MSYYTICPKQRRVEPSLSRLEVLRRLDRHGPRVRRYQPAVLSRVSNEIGRIPAVLHQPRPCCRYLAARPALRMQAVGDMWTPPGRCCRPASQQSGPCDETPTVHAMEQGNEGPYGKRSWTTELRPCGRGLSSDVSALVAAGDQTSSIAVETSNLRRRQRGGPS